MLPTDRLLAGYERRFPESADEVVRTVDGRLVNRSMVFVQKQHAFMQQGHPEPEAFRLTEKALAEEEMQALKQLEVMTTEARVKGGAPALSALEKDKQDGRWERLQFWRKELKQSPYEAWSHGKQASLDRWMTQQLLGWEPHQTRYLGQERFRVHLQAVRELIFADVLGPLRHKLRTAEADEALTEEDLWGLRHQQALGEFRDWEGKLLGKRAGEWPAEDLAALQDWLDANHAMVLTGTEDATPQVEGGVTDQERRQARRNVLQYMAFPLLRPEMQGVPYLSRYLTRAFNDVAKHEAVAGLRPILAGPLGKRKADYAAAEATLNDALPKMVVKTFVTLALERPFAWQLLRYLLVYRVANAPSVEALENLPELRGLGGRGNMAKHVEGQFKNVTSILMTLATDDDTSGLGQDITLAYEAINELHRVAQELLHGESGAASHPTDLEIEAHVQRHHGWIDEDLAIGEVLRNYDATVESMFGSNIPPAHRAQQDAMEKRESDVLEAARLDFAFVKREGGRVTWEKSAGFVEMDAYDQKWLARKARGKGATKEEDAKEWDVEVNPEDVEDWKLELRSAGVRDGTVEDGEEANAKGEEPGSLLEELRGMKVGDERQQQRWGDRDGNGRGGSRRGGFGGRGGGGGWGGGGRGWQPRGAEGNAPRGGGRFAGGGGRDGPRRADAAAGVGDGSFRKRGEGGGQPSRRGGGGGGGEGRGGRGGRGGRRGGGQAGGSGGEGKKE